jgi:thiamine biosynthesis lipoprotein
MNRRHFLGMGIGLGAVAALRPKLFARELRRIEQKSIAFGSQVSLTAYHENPETATRAIKEAFRALEEIEDRLSLYRPHSQLCELNRKRVLEEAHADTLTVIRSAVEWARFTDGAFDPTVQPLWALHASGQRPSRPLLQNVRRLVDWRQVNIQGTNIRLAPGQQITLNAIAPGFAADRVRAIFLERGIEHALVNTGEFYGLGSNPEGNPWRIGIQHPRVREAYAAIAAVKDRCVATSGDYETKFSEDFSRHHIFDPATGESPTTLSSVTVLAPTGMEADALSTAIFVLGPSRGLQLAKQRKDTDVFLILKSGDVVATPNFPKLA